MANELWAVLVLGMAEDGTKRVLDFEIGASKNAAVATAVRQGAKEGMVGATQSSSAASRIWSAT
ncbi:MAG: hypothetical protein ACLFV4_07160 [Candidatus Hydrogenedentota bacterium]